MHQFILFFSLMICHFLADFTQLSTIEMLQAKKFGAPVLPIWEHAARHAKLMAFPIGFFVAFAPPGYAFLNVVPEYFRCLLIAVGLCIFELITHGFIDIAKGRIAYKYLKFRDNQQYPYWWLFGADQFIHVMVVYLISWWATN